MRGELCLNEWGYKVGCRVEVMGNKKGFMTGKRKLVKEQFSFIGEREV